MNDTRMTSNGIGRWTNLRKIQFCCTFHLFTSLSHLVTLNQFWSILIFLQLERESQQDIACNGDSDDKKKKKEKLFNSIKPKQPKIPTNLPEVFNCGH